MKTSKYYIIFITTILFSFIVTSVSSNDIQYIVKEQIEIKNKMNDMENIIIRNNNMINNMDILNNRISIYFTLISIIATFIIILLPIINIFTVILPNKNLIDKLKSLEEDISKKIENNFDLYMSNFELKKHKKFMTMLSNNENIGFVLDYLFISYDKEYDESDYQIIIDYLNNHQDLENNHASIFHHCLYDVISLTCREYYRKIIESEKHPYSKFAIAYWAMSNIEDEIDYLAMVIKSYNKGEHLVIKLFNEIYNKYLGDPLFNKKPSAKIIEGEQRLKLLLNNPAIVNNFRPTNIDRIFSMNTSFLRNQNIQEWFPFIKETLLFRKYYSEGE